jgi:hypothetical protein
MNRLVVHDHISGQIFHDDFYNPNYEGKRGVSIFVNEGRRLIRNYNSPRNNLPYKRFEELKEEIMNEKVKTPLKDLGVKIEDCEIDLEYCTAHAKLTCEQYKKISRGVVYGPFIYI